MNKLTKNSHQVYLALRINPENISKIKPVKGWYNIRKIEQPIFENDQGEQYQMRSGYCDDLQNQTIVHRYMSNVWYTEERIRQLGGRVKKNQTPVSQRLILCDHKDQVVTYQLYNVDQTTIKSNIKSRNYNHGQRRNDIDQWIKTTKANIAEIGYSPCFLGDIDTIVFPLWRQFKSSNDYYATLFHEIGHWSGWKSRLERPSLIEQIDDKDPQYGVEEAIAELIAIKLCEYWNIEINIDQSIHYVDAWLGFLDRQQRIYMFRYCDSQADNAIKFLLNVEYDE